MFSCQVMYQTSEILSHISQALLAEGINNFRRFRLTFDTEGEYCSFCQHETLSRDQIIFDIECIRNIKSKHFKNYKESNSDLGMLMFQRKYPKHDDFFLFDIKHSYFELLSNKNRSSLINRLIKCIDVTYVLMTDGIKVACDKEIIEKNVTHNPAELSLDWIDLTESELSSLQLLSVIGTSKEVANVFDLSPRTIEKMTATLGKKLNIYNKMELQLFAKFLTSYIEIPYEYIQYPGDQKKMLSSNQYYVDCGSNSVG